MTPEGKILGQSGSVTKYICKKGGDLSTRVIRWHANLVQSQKFPWASLKARGVARRAVVVLLCLRDCIVLKMNAFIVSELDEGNSLL